MSNNLYSISQEMLELRDQLETENEFADESLERAWIESHLAIKQEELSTKIEGYLHVISQADAQADMAMIEITRIQKFAERKVHIVERLKASLLQALLLFGEEDANGVKRLEIGTHRLSTRRSKSVDILDEDAVTDDCKAYNVTFKNLTPDIKNFLAHRIEDLPSSIGKSALIRTFSPEVKISKNLIKNKLEEDDVSWAEIVTKYGLTIK